MTSEKQLIANQANAQSAGVKTEEGKMVVRHNSFKHGLSSKSILSDFKSLTETLEQYMEIVQGLRGTFNPTSYIEEVFIESMAKALFKLRRYDIVEATMFADEQELFCSGATLRVQRPGQLELILKYKQSLEVQFYRGLESLHKSRQAQQMDLFLKNEGKA